MPSQAHKVYLFFVAGGGMGPRKYGAMGNLVHQINHGTLLLTFRCAFICNYCLMACSKLKAAISAWVWGASFTVFSFWKPGKNSNVRCLEQEMLGHRNSTFECKSKFITQLLTRKSGPSTVSFTNAVQKRPTFSSDLWSAATQPSGHTVLLPMLAESRTVIPEPHVPTQTSPYPNFFFLPFSTWWHGDWKSWNRSWASFLGPQKQGNSNHAHWLMWVRCSRFLSSHGPPPIWSRPTECLKYTSSLGGFGQCTDSDPPKPHSSQCTEYLLEGQVNFIYIVF